MSIEQYIRQAARARGIDPEIAVRVARSEGGLKDPTRQSLVMKNGAQEPSYGPFQLLIGGGNSGFPEGMGNAALKAGIDPRDPNQWQRGVDFALDNAARDGWGAWYGAKAAGIGNREGIGSRGLTLNSAPTKIPEPGQLAPVITGGREINDRPVAGILDAPAAATADKTDSRTIAQVFKEDGLGAALEAAPENAKFSKGFDAFISAMGGGSSGRNAQAEAHAAPIQSSLPAFEAADQTRMATAQQLMNTLMAGKRKKVPGLSLMG